MFKTILYHLWVKHWWIPPLQWYFKPIRPFVTSNCQRTKYNSLTKSFGTSQHQDLLFGSVAVIIHMPRNVLVFRAQIIFWDLKKTKRPSMFFCSHFWGGEIQETFSELAEHTLSGSSSSLFSLRVIAAGDAVTV